MSKDTKMAAQWELSWRKRGWIRRRELVVSEEERTKDTCRGGGAEG